MVFRGGRTGQAHASAALPDRVGVFLERASGRRAGLAAVFQREARAGQLAT